MSEEDLGRDSDWHQETRRDMERALGSLDSLATSVSGSLSREQIHILWQSYLFVEKSAAFIKIELDDENPGRFISQRPYTVPDERQAIGFARRHLKIAIDDFDAGGLGASLKELRESRNYLRVLLKRVRRRRLRDQKAA